MFIVRRGFRKELRRISTEKTGRGRKARQGKGMSLTKQRMLKAMAWASWGNFSQFFWVSPMYTGSIDVIKVSLMTRFPAKNSE